MTRFRTEGLGVGKLFKKSIIITFIGDFDLEELQQVSRMKVCRGAEPID